MVSSKAPLAAAVALLAQICQARNHLVFRNDTESPPRTVIGEQGCYTDFGRDYRVSIPTFSRLYSYTFPVTAYSYFIPSTSTITVTPTVTGGGGGGGGGGTGPITPTSTVTTTTHVTSLGSMTTITAGPHFTPLASALQHRRPEGGRPQLQETKDSGYRIDSSSDSLVLGVDKAGIAKAYPPLWPQAVVCEKVIRVFTTSTLTITASYAATTTITLPGPSSTTTSVRNATTTTTTVTSTITDEVPNPTQTVYQACQANNLVSGHGQPQTYFVEAIHSWHVVREQRIAETAEKCCIACQGEADCGGSLYHMFSGICYTFRTGGGGGGGGRGPGGNGDHGGHCRAPGELRSSADVADGAVFVASNGHCGGWWVSDEAPI
ncbi:hypothetical protein SGCOL_003544 [Colletotrichum sp. CLE4]